MEHFSTNQIKDIENLSKNLKGKKVIVYGSVQGSDVVGICAFLGINEFFNQLQVTVADSTGIGGMPVFPKSIDLIEEYKSQKIRTSGKNYKKAKSWRQKESNRKKKDVSYRSSNNDDDTTSSNGRKKKRPRISKKGTVSVYNSNTGRKVH